MMATENKNYNTNNKSNITITAPKLEVVTVTIK